jgi:hypothetical protein
LNVSQIQLVKNFTGQEFNGASRAGRLTTVKKAKEVKSAFGSYLIATRIKGRLNPFILSVL